MKHSKFGEERIISILRAAEKGGQTIAVSLRQRREAVGILKRRPVSELRSCQLAGLSRPDLHDQGRQTDGGLLEKLKAIAQEHPRYGTRAGGMTASLTAAPMDIVRFHPQPIAIELFDGYVFHSGRIEASRLADAYRSNWELQFCKLDPDPSLAGADDPVFSHHQCT